MAHPNASSLSFFFFFLTHCEISLSPGLSFLRWSAACCGQPDRPVKLGALTPTLSRPQTPNLCFWASTAVTWQRVVRVHCLRSHADWLPPLSTHPHTHTDCTEIRPSLAPSSRDPTTSARSSPKAVAEVRLRGFPVSGDKCCNSKYPPLILSCGRPKPCCLFLIWALSVVIKLH